MPDHPFETARRADRVDQASEFDLHDLERIAAEAARRAAELVRSNYGHAQVSGTKSSLTDVVTVTDIETEDLIRGYLAEATPDASFVGEEGGLSSESQRLEWVIDPLDGTINFFYGIPLFSVSIAAVVDGEVVAAAVVDVLRDEMFTASLGNGARLNGTAIQVSGCSDISLALITTGFSYTSRIRELQGRIIAALLPVVRDIRCFGSAALNLCWAGLGRVDGYFERDIKVWDWAAGALIASEAGAAVEFPCPENDGLVFAASPDIAQRLRSLTHHLL